MVSVSSLPCLHEQIINEFSVVPEYGKRRRAFHFQTQGNQPNINSRTHQDGIGKEKPNQIWEH
jgi:hypothetical protein